MESSSIMTFLSIVVGIALLALPSQATQFTVGDTSGWDSSTDLNTWLQAKTFKVGDSLSFQYSSLHSVLEVSKADYTACSSSNAIQSYTGGSTLVQLKTAGTMYFICGTPGHCSGGMKMAVPVTAAATSTPTSPSTNTPPTTTTPSTPSGTTTNTSSDSAPIVKNVGVFFGAGLAMAAAFVL